MKILSHRGYWLTKAEANTELSFKRSLQAGFGIETDIRDCAGRLVVSHDPPNGEEMSFSSFLSIHKKFGSSSVLALNIKSDGLHEKIKAALADYQIDSYFMFDMSVPDTLNYKSCGLNFFSRVSEYEPVTSILPESSGVWLDAFRSDWYDKKLVQQLLDAGLTIAVVSPELHQRGHDALWEMLKYFRFEDRLLLCTDFPGKAKEFFDE